jgi:hypothetical protein
MVNDTRDTLRGAFTFNSEFFRQFHARHDVFLRGVILIVVVALIAALPSFVIALVQGLNRQPATSASQAYDQAMRQAAPFMQSLPPEVVAQMRQGFELGAEVATRIEALPTPIPQPVGRSLQTLAGWLSRPFGGATFPLAAAALGTWLGYGILVMLCARLLGGRGDMAGFFGTTSLYAVPHLLNVLNPVPYVGAIVGFIAFVWGAAIYVKATAISQEVTLERAILMVVLPLLVVLALLILLAIALISVIAIAAGRPG